MKQGKHMRKSIIVVALAAASVPISAQTVVSPIAPAAPVQTVAVIAPTQQENVLRAGTEIPMVTREELTTKKKKVKSGQRVQLAVATDITQNGVVIIPAGTPGVGEVTEVRNKGMWGKSGYIAVRILSVRVGDRQIRLTGTFDDKGVTGTAGVVGAVALVPIAGFFISGTSAVIPTGSPVKAFLDEDIAFRPVQVSPQVLEVPAPAAKPVEALPAAPPASSAPSGT